MMSVYMDMDIIWFVCSYITQVNNIYTNEMGKAYVDEVFSDPEA